MRSVRSVLAALALLTLTCVPALADDRSGETPLLHRHRGHRPTVVHRVHAHRACRYEAGHWETRVRRVVLPGHYVERVLPERYEVRWDPACCAYVRVLVRPRRIVREWVPERIEEHRERVWVPERWVCSPGC